MKKWILIFLVWSEAARAIEMSNPLSLCDRYLSESEQKDCEKKMKSLSPDWYLASVCSLQDDDLAFEDCLKISTQGPFSPKKLGFCTLETLSDSDRLSCVRASRVDLKEAFQQTSSNRKWTSRKKPTAQRNTASEKRESSESTPSSHHP